MWTVIQTKINDSAKLAMNGKLGCDTRPLYCLNCARKIIEHAYGLGERGFYKLITGEGSNPTALQIERGFRKDHPSWVVDITKSNIQVGDLLFWNYLPPIWGHVGVVVDFNANGVLEVAQNTTNTYHVVNQYQGALRTIALKDLKRPTTVVRLPAHL
jgi:hypothetical protein